MKSNVILALCLFITAYAFGQTRATRMSSPDSNAAIEEFYLSAGNAEQQTGLLVPAIQKAREAASRAEDKRFYSRLETLLKNAQSFARTVQSTGGNMSRSQYQSYQDQLANFEIQLTSLSGQVPANGPAPGTMGECFKSCDDAYGKGFGGGKGWNRFWCKSGCIISQSVPGN